ncbi:unnamed protein product [Phytophthora lilii]|uniref:Unnamed protein product n=1 Tax=Phytophthora lilii TaxID=2077276 RepID=A0A9W6WGE4_9STRA|nr:unnamed protein product [Phytophthora lilii]
MSHRPLFLPLNRGRATGASGTAHYWSRSPHHGLRALARGAVRAAAAVRGGTGRRRSPAFLPRPPLPASAATTAADAARCGAHGARSGGAAAAAALHCAAVSARVPGVCGVSDGGCIAVERHRRPVDAALRAAAGAATRRGGVGARRAAGRCLRRDGRGDARACAAAAAGAAAAVRDALEITEGSFFALHASRMTFQVTSSVLENLAVLSSASVFRILLFRASHGVVGSAFGDSDNLWDSLAAVKPKEGDVASALFATDIAAAPQSSTPLNEQYLQGLHKRMDAALKLTSDKKTPDAPADAEDVQILDSLFKFENLLTGCKYDAAARESLFASRDRWNALFSSTTAVIDGFTLMLSLLNTLPDRKGSAGDNSPTGALALEQSVASLLRFLNSKQHAHPLLLLHQYPHLANLRISSASVKSPIKFFVESKLQFAIRRFLLEEARRRVFQRAKVVHAAESLLCHLVSVSRAEDKQGYVQVRVNIVVHTLTSLLTVNAL